MRVAAPSQRKRAKKRTMTILLALFAAFLAVFLIEPFCVTLKREQIPGPSALSGLKIAFVSDLHAEGTLSVARIAKAAERVAAEQPDVIILGGDYADSTGFAKAALLPFAVLNPTLGVFAVAGNHDSYYNLQSVLADLPITLLDNSGRTLPFGQGTLYLAGVADHLQGAPDLAAALAANTGADMTVLVSHNPRAVRPVAGMTIDFALCGHTHGGQATIFGLYSPLADRAYPAFTPQWVDHGGIPTLYSNGLGTTFLPIRFMARPQIHMLEITD